MPEYTKKEVNVEGAREELRKLILNKGLKWAEGFFPNGEKAKWMFDLREIMLTPEGSRLAALLIYEKIKNIGFDMIGGPSIAAEPLVAALVLHSCNEVRSMSGFIVRKQPNEFGLRKRVEGPVNNGKKVILIDDALNFGASMSDAVEALKQEGCSVIKIITLLDFCKSGHHKLMEGGYGIDYIFNLEDFGLETNNIYKYKSIAKSAEIRPMSRKETMLKKLNEVLGEEIIDFKIYKNLILTAYKDGCVYCFNQNDYSVAWNLELGEYIAAPILIDNGMAVISAYSGLKTSMAFFISIANGKVVENIRIDGKINSAPALCRDIYLMASTKKLYCIGRQNHKITWIFETDGTITSSPLVDSTTEIIYLCSSDNNLYALNINGELLWKKHIGNIAAAPLIYREKIILNSDIGVIFCLDKSNGNLIWFFELKNKAFDMKIIFDKLAIGCAQGYLLVLDITSGKIFDCFKISDENIKEISEHNKRLAIGLENGKNYLIEA